MKLVIFSILFVHIYLELCAYFGSFKNGFVVGERDVETIVVIDRCNIPDHTCDRNLVEVKYVGDGVSVTDKNNIVDEIIKRLFGDLFNLNSHLLSYFRQDAKDKLKEILDQCKKLLKMWQLTEQDRYEAYEHVTADGFIFG
ncbi:conserved protein, unknown function [Hepatocystis sp. ex Piliocolobus tephrosceles]|nr:conserved protein, unknown function [Hepatocystis sp. ex Piliocolobus tephrosceles]